MADLTKHLVIPGQVIAMSSEDEPENAFLRGHGTYVDTIPGDSGSGGDEGTNAIEMQGADADPSHPAGGRKRLIASVAGVIERVNKLVSVVPVSSTVYSGQVGDLIVGRISSVGATRWKVGLAPAARSASSGGGPSPLCRDGQLPLSGVDLPGGGRLSLVRGVSGCVRSSAARVVPRLLALRGSRGGGSLGRGSDLR